MANKTVVQRSGLKWQNSLGEKIVELRVPIWTAMAPDGTTEKFDGSELSREMLQLLLVHGRSKIHDAAALDAADFPGNKIPNSARIAAMRDVWANLLAGQWSAKREGLTPEQKAQILKSEVMAAWIALGTGESPRTEGEFNTMIFAKAKSLGLDEGAMIAALSKNARIIAKRAELEKSSVPEGIASAVEEMV